MTGHCCALSDDMGRVVTRKRLSVHGSLRRARDATGVAVGTWARLESGEEVRYSTLVRVCIGLGWLAEDADLLLAEEDPDASRISSPTLDAVSADLATRIGRLDPLGQARVSDMVDQMLAQQGA